MRLWLYMLYVRPKSKISNFSHSPYKINVWMSTTCFTSMYKNMYNPKSKIIFFLVSSIAIMLVDIQGENKWKQEDKTSQDKKVNWMVQLKLFSIVLLLNIYSKKSTHLLFGAWSFLLVHIWFTPSEGPKGFVNWFFKKLDHGSWTIKLEHGNFHLPYVWIHGPWCKPALKNL